MSDSADRLFGAATAEPALAGSYGVTGPGGSLPDETLPGPAVLQVADLDRSRAFYEGVLGFAARPWQGDLGLFVPGTPQPLIVLHERRGAAPWGARRTFGLFHVALLLPDRAALGRFLRHATAQRVRLGASDHLVSEALYLSDPDGLGLEVYADRPRAAWMRVGRELKMATDPLDFEGLLREAGDAPWGAMPAGARVGHLHLHVGDLAGAGAFYGDALGFTRMVWRYPGALFLAAGGYHHHLGTNTWAGPHARPAAADEAQLLAWTLDLGQAPAVAAARERLAAAGHSVRDLGGGACEVRDPWGTALRLVWGGADRS